MQIFARHPHGKTARWTMVAVCASLGLVTGVSHGAPAVGPTGSTQVQVAQARLEDGMAELARATAQADQAGDMVRAACLLDKQQRGAEVLELATHELLVAQDANATAQQRSFAVEKLGALSERMGQLVAQADGCAGDTAPEDTDDRTRTDVDRRASVPYSDATVIGTGQAQVPPAVEDTRPATVESPTS